MPHRQAIPIRFADLDALGHVNHATMLVYAETIRCDWFAEALGIADMRELPFIVAAANIQYKAPIHKGTALVATMWTSKIGTKSWTFSYQLHDDSQVFAEIETVQVAYDYEASRTCEISSILRRELEFLVA